MSHATWGVERDHRASLGRPGVLGEERALLAVGFWASSVVSVVSPLRLYEDIEYIVSILRELIDAQYYCQYLGGKLSIYLLYMVLPAP